MPTIESSVIKISSAASGGSTASVELISAGDDPDIVAVYVTTVNGSLYGGALTPRVEFSPPTNGTVVTVDIQKVEDGAGKILQRGDVVWVSCADAGGSERTTVT